MYFNGLIGKGVIKIIRMISFVFLINIYFKWILKISLEYHHEQREE